MKDLIDLHTHTFESDADINLSPEKLVRLAYENEFRAISLTDHDSIANVDRTIEAGKKLGLEVVPGLELSTFEGSLEPHFLGYYLDYNNPRLVKSLKKQTLGRDMRSKMSVELLNKAGANLDFDELRKKVKGAYVAKYHIALELIEKGFIDDVMSALKGQGKWKEFDVPYSAVKEYLFNIEQGIKFLRKYDAVVVLAHPGSLKLGREEERKFLEKSIKWGLQGIEVYTRRHNKEQTNYYEGLAKEYGLLITGGTDFHGIEPDVFIGAGYGDLKIPYKLLEELKRFKGL